MNTIRIFLAESGRVADLKKDFPLYQGQFQNKLLNVYVPTSILAPEFTTLSEQGQTLNEYVAGTAVKIGMRYLTRSGEIKVSESRYMRYLKTLTYQGVEYALFERKLPKEFTLYAGQGQNAPVLIINVVNIETDTDPSEILSLIPSQSCSLDVMPSSNLDNDETIEPSEVDTINARLNAIDETLVEKQDKVDESINLTTDEDDNVTWQDSHSVVGSINNNTQQNEINKSNIETNTSDIAINQGDIAYLYAHLSQPEEYIGQMEGSSLPTNSQLTNFVEETVEREPKNADVIIFILQIAGETDKNYKYIYAVDGWNGYEIPPLEEASNGSLGLIEGTYNVGSTNDTLVDISGGKITNIYVKDGTNTYRNIREYLNTTTTNIANIVNGSTSVGKALTAIADELGNNIVNTYLTQSAGATKDFVRNYALPRTFNDIFFIYRDPNDVNKGTYGGDVPSQTQQFTKTTSAVGDFTICELTMENILQRKFELSRKNSCQNSFWITANRNCVATFRLTTQVKLAGEDYVDLAVELTSHISITAGSLQRVDITSVFSYLNDTVINFSSLSDMIKQTLEVITQESTSTTFSVYSSETYPSTFNLNTTSLVLYNTLGKLGEQPVYELMPSGAITSSGVDLVGSDAAQIYNNTECYLKITIPMDTEGYDDYFGENCYIHSITLGGDSIRLKTPYNYLYGQLRFSDLKQVIHYFTDPVAAYYMMKCFVQIDSGDNITFIVDEDNVSGKLDKSSETNKVYGTDSSGNQTMIGYDTTPTGNIARRDTNSQLSVPLTPTANEHSTSKKYVDDTVKGSYVPNTLIDPNKTYLVVRIPTDNDEFTLFTGTTGSPNYTIEWGDGSSEDVVDTSNPTHTYSKAGMYLITISGSFTNGIDVGSNTIVNQAKMIEVYGGTNYPTSISNYAFSGCENLTTANFPNATIVEGNAFFSCTSLTTATFPKVTSIGTYAFYICSSLTTAIFPKATSIGTYAFHLCPSLITANIPKATSIGDYAFNNCSSLTTANIPNATTMGNNAFFNCTSLTTAIFPKVTSLESNAFSGCTSLTTANFPRVTSIDNNAFFNCTSLKTLTLGNVTTTETGTRFTNVKLDNLTISGTITDTDIVRIKNLIISNGGSFSQSYEIKYGLQVEKEPTLDNDAVRKIDLDSAIQTAIYDSWGGEY